MNIAAPTLPAWSVLIPFRDEAGNVAPLLSEVRRAMQSLGPYEVIAIDDGSRDATAAELTAWALTDPRLRIATHVASAGQSQALITAAMLARAPWIITLDGDGQNNPADISGLVSAWAAAGAEAEHTLFIGWRRRRRDPWAKRAGSRIANKVRARLLGDRTPDGACGLKLLRRDLLLGLPRFDALHRFLPALVLRSGGQVVSLPVAHRPRCRGRSKYGLWRRAAAGLVDLLGVYWLMHRHTPPRLAAPQPQNFAKNSRVPSLDLTQARR